VEWLENFRKSHVMERGSGKMDTEGLVLWPKEPFDYQHPQHGLVAGIFKIKFQDFEACVKR
jgi:hypothetical protein